MHFVVHYSLKLAVLLKYARRFHNWYDILTIGAEVPKIDNPALQNLRFFISHPFFWLVRMFNFCKVGFLQDIWWEGQFTLMSFNKWMKYSVFLDYSVSSLTFVSSSCVCTCVLLCGLHVHELLQYVIYELLRVLVCIFASYCGRFDLLTTEYVRYDFTGGFLQFLSWTSFHLHICTWPFLVRLWRIFWSHLSIFCLIWGVVGPNPGHLAKRNS